jgi:hypothetical protein
MFGRPLVILNRHVLCLSTSESQGLNLSTFRIDVSTFVAFCRIGLLISVTKCLRCIREFTV